ncbi:MAG: hypothetical protein JWS10_2476 [Cypionkella sp.]|uniref:hypothetical protein n=1 Tax=Cypionkella sp. TaxID=2811411 RepID=UPI002608BB0E|nr:hypothetical protein [Cypionkella sp.]MDB5659861.1 hypothetical protein [Cypionkella sp.]MDB5663896.1 hypothetical protein [Cypionkella sp.]
MAVVSMLAGGMLGLFSAVFSLVALDASWLMAFGLWSGIGAAAAFALLGWAMRPHRKLAAPHRTEHA